jgi:hypothetical protein
MSSAERPAAVASVARSTDLCITCIGKNKAGAALSIYRVRRWRNFVDRFRITAACRRNWLTWCGVSCGNGNETSRRNAADDG